MAQLLNGEEYLKDVFTEKRPVYNKILADRSILPEQEVRQTLAKANAWQVCKSWADEENKRFVYDVMLNAHESEIRVLSFEDACKIMHWSDFEIVNNGQSIKWTADQKWLDGMPALMARAKVNAKKNLEALEKQKAEEAKKKAKEYRELQKNS